MPMEINNNYTRFILFNTNKNFYFKDWGNQSYRCGEETPSHAITTDMTEAHNFESCSYAKDFLRRYSKELGNEYVVLKMFVSESITLEKI